MEISSSDRRLQIVDKATELFLDSGFSGTSMSAIATASGITKASLYHHFKGKDALFIACVTHGYSAALRELEAIVADEGRTPAEKMEASLRMTYDITIASPVGRMSPLIAEVSRAFPNVARSFHTEYIAPQQNLMWQIVEAGMASGDFGPVDRKQLFHLIFGPIVTLSLTREMFASFDDLDDHFPVTELRDGHIRTLMKMLRQDGLPVA